LEALCCDVSLCIFFGEAWGKRSAGKPPVISSVRDIPTTDRQVGSSSEWLILDPRAGSPARRTPSPLKPMSAPLADHGPVLRHRSGTIMTSAFPTASRRPSATACATYLAVGGIVADENFGHG